MLDTLTKEQLNILNQLEFEENFVSICGNQRTAFIFVQKGQDLEQSDISFSDVHMLHNLRLIKVIDQKCGFEYFALSDFGQSMLEKTRKWRETDALAKRIKKQASTSKVGKGRKNAKRSAAKIDTHSS